MPKPIYFVGPWDLSRDLPCVPDDPSQGHVVLVESVEKSRALPFHRQKLVLVLSAMRHFAEELRKDGYSVTVRRSRNYVSGIRATVRELNASEVVAMRPREWAIDRRFEKAVQDDSFGAPTTLHDSGGEGAHFFLSRDEFARWAGTQKELRMHRFYAWMRKRTGYLMEGGKPVGGKYSFDAANRKHARGATPPAPPVHAVDTITEQAMREVAEWPFPTWGKLDGFDWPVTRAQALDELEDFFERRAEHFGRFQDAMLRGEPYLWHTRIGAAMNLSLVSPREVCDRIQRAYDEGSMPIESAEGLLRQVLGWREFVRGVYWRGMPGMRTANVLGAKRRLPQFFWEPAQTEMQCLRQSAQQVFDHGYAHHIQRLMVLGNFALLAGIEPIDVSHWFWAGFVDAFEWVQLPNVHGMALYADDSFTTKPYAASGSYITRMSDYCGSCGYDVSKRTGESACPFNYLYWNFVSQHRDKLASNPRARMMLRTWERFDKREQSAITKESSDFLAGLLPANHGWVFADNDG